MRKCNIWAGKATILSGVGEYISTELGLEKICLSGYPGWKWIWCTL